MPRALAPARHPPATVRGVRGASAVSALSFLCVWPEFVWAPAKLRLGPFGAWGCSLSRK